MACSWTRNSCVGRVLNRKGGEIAAVDGFALRIGQRAALVPTPGAKIYGLVFSLTQSELDRLYSEPSVQAYKRQAVLAQLASGGVAAALCYNVPQPPSPTEEDRVPLVLFVRSLFLPATVSACTSRCCWAHASRFEARRCRSDISRTGSFR